MKCATIAIAAIVAMANVASASSAVAEVTTADSSPAVLPPAKALEVAQSASTPEGVEFTGSVEKIEQPADAKKTLDALQAKHGEDGHHDDKHEGYGWGGYGYGGGYGGGYGWGLGYGGGWGNWGNWGGWGGYGPYRFGFSCGGIPGWAYPLGYWNLFGAGLYGGGCGLGVSFGGLYYC